MKESELLEVLSSFNDVYLSGFGGIADRFSLTCRYNGYGENGVIFYKISEELAGIAENEIKDWAKRTAREQLKDCKNLPPFDGLYGEIEREYLDYFSKNEKFARRKAALRRVGRRRSFKVQSSGYKSGLCVAL